MSIPLPNIPVGGRLRYFKKKWKRLTSDPVILKMVNGVHIDVTKDIPPCPAKHPLIFSKEEQAATDEHIKLLLAKNDVVPSRRKPGDHVSTIFLHPKKTGGFRMILNLKDFNKLVEKIKLKMETLQHILDLVTENCYMTSIDLIDTYLTLTIALIHQKFLKFVWKGQVYMYIVLPFGLTSAPRLFTKILKPIISFLRKQGHIIVCYLDDAWQKAETYNECLKTCAATYNLFVECGFLPNPKKSSLVPQQTIDNSQICS